MGSQAGQDQFVIDTLKQKRGGIFLDIGCGLPVTDNNTILLEREFGWNGKSIDKDPSLLKYWEDNGRKGFINRNALELCFPCFCMKRVDYLSMDVDDAQMALVLKFPWERIRFSVMTIEHDAYRVGPKIRDTIRQVISSHGYEIVREDVAPTGKPFEDWWIDKSLLP